VKEEILVKLRSAEEDTAKRVANAKDRAAEILKQARVDAQQLVQQAQDEARRDEETKVAAERKRLEAERTRILEDGKRKEEGLRSAYQKRVDQHVEKALQSFERSA
jgi:vacuolar-type H+-ATPase subunit H